MSKTNAMVTFLMLSLITLLTTLAAEAQGNGQPYKVETVRWRASENQFARWQRDGVTLASNGTLQLDPQKARTATDPYAPGKYRGGNFYNGGTFLVGEATSPIITPAFPFSEAIPSWNANTPAGAWIEVQLRARVGSRWSGWYKLGVWASGQETVNRHSVAAQAGSNVYVDVDTLKIGKRGKPLTATAYQMKLRLFSTGRSSLPTVSSASVAVSTTPAAPTQLTPGNSARWNKVLQIPECSQMVYPDGGEVWCSPTSLAMVLSYWGGATGACEPGVRRAVDGVYDRVYKGHGNWPFNAAYAATQGMEAYVTRFTSFAQAEEWIAAGVPVVISYGWGRGDLTGAPVASSNGHLAVLAGFDRTGNPIVNDPAAPGNPSVQRTYPRAQLERLWLQGSGGTVYLVYPPGTDVPATR
jgi:hypothetical protein